MSAFVRQPDLSAAALHVWQRNRDVLLQLWKSEFVAQLLEPPFVIFALGLGLGQFVELENGQEYVAFLTPGLLAMFPMFTAVFECAWNSYLRLDQGTYRAILATPASIDDVITGEILWGATRSAVNASYILLVAGERGAALRQLREAIRLYPRGVSIWWYALRALVAPLGERFELPYVSVAYAARLR